MTRRETMNTQQTAEVIGCARSYVYRMIEDGRLQGYRIGERRGLRVYVDSIQKFIESREGE